MSCSSDSTKNTDIKKATYDSLNNLNKYTGNNVVFTPKNINNPFNDDFISSYAEYINTDLDELDDNKNDLFIRDEKTCNIYQNCAIQANNPWFTSSIDYKKCEIVNNIVLDNKLNLSADKTKIILNLKSKNKSKPAYSSHFFNVNNAFCENKWYDWIITPNYYLGNTYYKDTSKYREVDVYKCYKPCDDDYLPFKTEKGIYTCIPKKYFGNGIFSNKYMFSAFGLINLIGNIVLNELLTNLHISTVDFNIEKNVDEEIYKKNEKVYVAVKNSYDITDARKLFIECINNNILNDFSSEKEQDYTYIKEFTYKHRRFNENEPEMYSLSGLDSCGALTYPILHHTWILANLFKPIAEEDIEIIKINTTLNDKEQLKIKKDANKFKFKGSIILFDKLKEIFNNDDNKAIRLKNIFYKAVNICYNNNTNFSTNIINLTKKSFEYYKNKHQNYDIILKTYYSDSDETILNDLYSTDNKPFFKEHKFYKDFELNELIIRYPEATVILGNKDGNDNNDNNDKFKYLFSSEDLEIRTCEKGYVYNKDLHQCEIQATVVKVKNEEVGDDMDDDLDTPKLVKIFFIFLQIILFIIGLYIIYVFYDIFGEIILTLYNFIYMKIAEYNVYFGKTYGPSIVPRNFEGPAHQANYYADLDYKLASLQYENLKTNKLKIDDYISSHIIPKEIKP